MTGLALQKPISARVASRDATLVRERALLGVRNISKTYVSRGFRELLGLRPARRHKALSDVSFDLHAGEVTALLGPNGAGKTTLVNIICDLVRADAGTVTVAGLPVPEQSLAARRHIGYVTTNDRSFFWRLSARKNLEFFAAMHGFTGARGRALCEEMLERFRLREHADELFHTFSAGMKKRLGLARAFLHGPAVLLLDEATNGLDTRSTEELLDLIREHSRVAGRTVLWATHRVEEVERICSHALVIVGGRLHFSGDAEDFMRISRRRMTFAIHATLPASNAGIGELLAQLRLRLGPRRPRGCDEICGEGDEQHMSAVLEALLARGVIVRQIERESEPLHQVFSHLAAADTEGGPAG